MAVKRVILQHFSMRYDYMTKERPNIYQPSSINCQEENGDYKVNEKVAINKSIMGRSSTNDLESKLNKMSRGGGGGGVVGGENESRRRDEMNYKKSFNRSLDNSGGCLDSIIELKEKLPEIARRQRKLSNVDVKEVNGEVNKKLNKIIPEENWRYRSSSNSADASPTPLGFRNYRNFNHHNTVASSRHHSNSSSSCESNKSSGGVEIKNWRNECIYSAVRNCGMIAAGDGRASINISNDDDDDDDCIVGLSPPSESILMQRRLRNRASEIMCSPSATASG